MRRLLLIGAVAAMVAANTGAAARTMSQPSDPSNYWTRILGAPTHGEEFGFRAAMQQYAQGRSDRMFNALASLLGGTAPRLNFVQDGSPLLQGSVDAGAFVPLSANIADNPGGPRGSINLGPEAVNGLINDNAQTHNVTVNQMPHEMAHTRQTAATLSDLLSREGGAQAFADMEATPAAVAAHIPYAGNSTNRAADGAYADLVKQIMATRGPDWVTRTQFGH